MNSKMDEFKTFVSKHPLLKDEVRDKKITWQNVYEEWVLYGETDESWKKYEVKEPSNNNAPKNSINMDSVKNIIDYVQKLNPDSVNKTLSTVQKVIQIAQTFSGGKGVSSPITQGSLYSDWWD